MRGNTRASSWSCKIAPRGGEARRQGMEAPAECDMEAPAECDMEAPVPASPIFPFSRR